MERPLSFETFQKQMKKVFSPFHFSSLICPILFTVHFLDPITLLLKAKPQDTSQGPNVISREHKGKFAGRSYKSKKQR